MRHGNQQSGAPLIVIALMVKNESLSIQHTLGTLLHAGIRDFFILDTGSGDNTMELAAFFFKEHGLNGHIKQELFIDFSTSRNRALELTEHYFPEHVFILMLDAEWELHNPQGLLDYCEQQRHQDTPLYLITLKMNDMEFSAARLFRAAKHIRFKGVVHEVPDVLAQVKIPSPAYIEVKATASGIEKSQLRWKQDLHLLLKAHTDDPYDARTAFYLAQTYECLHDYEHAYKYYQHRSQLQGWDEENFITLFRLGCLATKIKQDNETQAWAVAMDYFLKAFSSRPHRIEPLLKIAEHYWPNNIQSSYLFTQYAYGVPYPEDDLLFIDKEAYEYTRYELMSRAAWYMNQYTLGEEATVRALKANPEQEHLHKNLMLYRQKLEHLRGRA